MVVTEGKLNQSIIMRANGIAVIIKYFHLFAAINRGDFNTAAQGSVIDNRTNACVSLHVAAALVSGPAEAAHPRVRSLGTPGTVYERRDGTWKSSPNLRRTFIVNTWKCNA